MCLWRFLPPHAEWRGTIGFPVPRNSTSNWAIATCLTRVFPSTLSPNTPIGQSEEATSTTVPIRILDQILIFLFVSVLLWAPRLLYIVWVGNSHLVHHQCSIITNPGTVFSCHRKFRFFYLEDCLQIHLMEASWTERTGTFKHQRSANRRLKTQSTVLKRQRTHPKKKKDTKKCFFLFCFGKRLVSCEWKRRYFYHTVIKTTSSTLCFMI